MSNSSKLTLAPTLFLSLILYCMASSILFAMPLEMDKVQSNVSHQLRTPVTSFKLFLGLLKKLPPTDYAEILDMLSMEADRLQRTIEDVLRLSRLDQGRESLTLTAVDLNALATECVNEHEGADRPIVPKLRFASILAGETARYPSHSSLPASFLIQHSLLSTQHYS